MGSGVSSPSSADELPTTLEGAPERGFSKEQIEQHLGRSVCFEDKELFTGEHYKLEGKMDKESQEYQMKVYTASAEAGFDLTNPEADVVQPLRKVMELSAKEVTATDSIQQFITQCDIEVIAEMGGPDFHPGATAVSGFVIRLKKQQVQEKDEQTQLETAAQEQDEQTQLEPAAQEKDEQTQLEPDAQACLVYFHGGAVIAGTAEQYNGICCRYATEAACTVVNVNYRLAPETCAPGGIDDSYAAVKWVLANAATLKIDPTRVAIVGDSGGGYIVAGVGMRLAEAGEGHLVRYQMQLVPMVSNCMLAKPESECGEEELMGRQFLTTLMEHISGKKDWDKADPNLFPNEISDALCQKAPPLIALTTEFDDCRQGTEEAAEKFRKNYNLIALGIIAGCDHDVSWNPKHGRFGVWYKAVADATTKYLAIHTAKQQ